MDIGITIFGVGRFTPTLLSLVIFVYLLQRKQKEIGTIWFTYYFFFLTIFNFGYLFGYSMNEPSGRFGWYLACSIVFAAASRLQISFTFPYEVYSRFRKIMLITSFCIGSLSILDYLVRAAGSYNFAFSTHSFGSKYSSLFIPFSSFLFYSLSIMISLFRVLRIIRHAKGNGLQKKIKHAWFQSSELPISLSLIGITIAEVSLTVFYFLTVNQIFKTNVLAEILNLGGLLIFVGYSFVYSSSASGRIGIITRLIGITLVSFLVVLHSVTRFYQEQLIQGFENHLIDQTRTNFFMKDGGLKRNPIYTIALEQKDEKSETVNAIIRQEFANAISDDRFHYFNLGTYRLAAVKFSIGDQTVLGIIPYDEYRIQIHKILYPSLLFFSLVALLILFAFPLLFRANFSIPLNNLMKDLSEISPGSFKKGVVPVADEIVRLRKSFLQMAELIKKAKGNMPEVSSQIEILDKILNLESQKIQVGNQTLVYRSQAVRKTLDEVSQASRYRYPILITGETGTGKELISKLIHESSEEAKGPFVAINCATLPESLWESEIFGHRKGSFTDARSDRKGRILEASGGSVFFDEIGEMPLSIQAKMLRLLQENTFSPIGSDLTLKAECRFIFATNRNLDEMVKQKSFREDLLYRIRVIPISLPALRDRVEDIPDLIRFFVDRFAIQYQIKSPEIDTQLMQRLVAYSWPGNIREMENTVIRAMASHKEGALSLDHFQNLSIGRILMENEKPLGDDLLMSSSYEEQVQRFAKNLIASVYKQCKGNVTKTAKVLSMKRTTLRYQLIELGILDPKK
ncbi:AAA family ATPase [Leptospira ognonensis]|uniref:AAA family ATPase n=1 Tax=Leptospira ognonensis TaxID=2484945 RepID=A0A4R9JY42_9LEPT|nr:sigma-54 dependent transcriptional regulator [Leptospira ognonensis]TGL58140.1 AAA family ATPase [Leptospira ognonensis]